MLSNAVVGIQSSVVVTLFTQDKVNGIVSLFSEQSQDKQVEVRQWTKLLLESYQSLIPNRFDVGRALCALRDATKTLAVDPAEQRNNYLLMLREVKIHEKTAGRYIKLYEELNEVAEPLRAAALRRGFDLAEGANASLRIALKAKTVEAGEEGFSERKASRVFEAELSSIEAQAAEAAAKKAMELAEAAKARKAKSEEALSDEADDVDSAAGFDMDEDDDEADGEGDEKITDAARTPRKGLRWFIQDQIGKGKTKEQIAKAVYAAYDRETTLAAKRAAEQFHNEGDDLHE